MILSLKSLIKLLESFSHSLMSWLLLHGGHALLEKLQHGRIRRCKGVTLLGSHVVHVTLDGATDHVEALMLGPVSVQPPAVLAYGPVHDLCEGGCKRKSEG